VIPVVTAAEMKAIDAASPEPVEALIGRAGAAVAHEARRMLGGTDKPRVAVIAGPGNNGADGRVAADLLRRAGMVVVVHDVGAVPDSVSDVDLVIDAGFGTGFRGTWSPPLTGAVPVLAVDVPTGLDADTGRAAAGTLTADRTVTFAAAKPGHVLGRGRDLCGDLVVAEIGLDVRSARIGIVEAGDVASWIPPRPRTAHKWSQAVRVVAGSQGMTGAAALTAAAAQRSGAGMVVVSMPGVSADVADVVLPTEAVHLTVAGEGWASAIVADLDRYHAVVIGPGLGRSQGTVSNVLDLIESSPIPVLIDGDGLYAIAQRGVERLRRRAAATVLTPHDGEFAQLTGARPGDDRIAAARQLAEASGATVVLKGPTTVVAAVSGAVLLVANGDQRLATAGTGDVLAGIVGALLAAGAPAEQAAAGGAWLHAAAGARHRHGLVASDLVSDLPSAFDEICS
jgi:NAD(P)H-hydrate epimerase